MPSSPSTNSYSTMGKCIYQLQCRTDRLSSDIGYRIPPPKFAFNSCSVNVPHTENEKNTNFAQCPWTSTSAVSSTVLYWFIFYFFECSWTWFRIPDFDFCFFSSGHLTFFRAAGARSEVEVKWSGGKRNQYKRCHEAALDTKTWTIEE